MRFCGDCGTSVSSDLNFCTTCGGSMGDPPVITAPSSPADAAAYDALPATYFSSDAPPDVAPRGPSWWSRRKAVVIGRVFLAVALLGTGLIIGWGVASDRDLVEIESGPTSEGIEARPAVAADEVAMPDLRGLAEADARQVLADSGVDPAQVTASEQSAAGESGIVLGQDPVYGYPIDGAITLAIASPATVPDYEGRTATEVLDDLDQLGAEVNTLSEYTPGVMAGNVVSIDPAPGTELPVAVTVVVAAEADSVNLAAISATEDTCYSEQETMNAVDFNNLITCSGSRTPEAQTWLIRRAGDQLTGTVGIPDNEPPRTVMRLDIVGDGEVLKSIEATYGVNVAFRVPVSGVLRLSLRYRTIKGDYGSGTVGIGRLSLSGDAAGLNKLDRY